jgi:N-carbamoylputrescine amidase
MSRKITVASIQMASGEWGKEKNIARAERLIRQASDMGANLVLCPELFMLPYFCLDQVYDYFNLAEEFEGNSYIAHFSNLAKELSVVIPIGFYERAGTAKYNSIAVADADGKILGVYRKTHIPDAPGYNEKFYFTPGDTGFRVWDTKFGKIGIGICWDQWFSETARCLVLKGAEILCFPTIIGGEPGSIKMDSAKHWQNTMRGHAAANMVPVVASNRIGKETVKGLRGEVSNTFYGSSFITDEIGEKVAEANRTEESVLIHTFDLDAIKSFRETWGIFRDRRPDRYNAILTSDGKDSIALRSNEI